MAPPAMEAGNSVVTFNLLATPESKEIMFNFFSSSFSDINILPCWLSQFRKAKLRQPTGQILSNFSRSHKEFKTYTFVFDLDFNYLCMY